MNGTITSRNGSNFSTLLNEKVSWSCALAIVFSILASPTHAQNPPGNTVFDLVPIGSTGTVTSLVGNTIEIPSGGVVVELELRISGWAATGDGTLSNVEAIIDGTGYCSGIGDALNPLGYPGVPILSCPQGNGCPTDGNTCDQGGFVKTRVCANSANAGDPCIMASQCPGGVCAVNPDYLFSDFQNFAGVQYSAGLDYTYGGGILSNFDKPDSGNTEMFGTLLVNIPFGAAGTYNINFLLDSNGTTTSDGLVGGVNTFAVVNLNGATITVTTGACCFNIGPGSTQCLQNVTQGVCAGQSGPSVLHPGQECPPIGPNNHGPDSGTGPCCGSGCQVDTDCNDGNACTTDICSAVACGCININNFNDATDCCNSFSGSLTPLDDLDPCTNDICDAQTGSVTHEPIINCTACMGDFDCDDNNACTNNSCDLITGACSNPLSFDVVTQCCDLATGAIVTFGDGNPCTNDFCDAQTFQVTHSPIPDCIFANNRYVTFFPNRGNLAVNYSLTETTSGRQKWLLPPTSTDDITHSIARLTDTMPQPRVWSSQALHIGDCIISPGFTYQISSTTDGLSFSAPVFVDTAGLPTDGRHWADCVGSFDTSSGNWGPPDGLLTASDILAVVQTFQLSLSSIPTPWADLSPERPNGIVNSSDILAVALAFQFAPYPHAIPANCP